MQERARCLGQGLPAGQGQEQPTRTPKYHIGGMLAAHHVSCQNHSLFLHGFPDPLVVECGAAGGQEASELSHRARIISFEANPSNYALARRNLAQQGRQGWYTIHHAAVGNRSGNTTFFVPDGSQVSQTGSLASQKWWSGNDARIQVPIVRLDDMVHEHVTLLKMDVQGAEPDIIDGCLPCLPLAPIC